MDGFAAVCFRRAPTGPMPCGARRREFGRVAGPLRHDLSGTTHGDRFLGHSEDDATSFILRDGASNAWPSRMRSPSCASFTRMRHSESNRSSNERVVFSWTCAAPSRYPGASGGSGSSISRNASVPPVGAGRAALRQVPDLGGHYRETAALFARACGFDRCRIEVESSTISVVFAV